MPYLYFDKEELNDQSLHALKEGEAPFSYNQRIEASLNMHEREGWTVVSVAWDDEHKVAGVLLHQPPESVDAPSEE